MTSSARASTMRWGYRAIARTSCSPIFLPTRGFSTERRSDNSTESAKTGEPMSKGRLEAFSDGVIAILITIMVLELKVPHGDDWDALRPLVPVSLTYVLSFVFL